MGEGVALTDTTAGRAAVTVGTEAATVDVATKGVSSGDDVNDVGMLELCGLIILSGGGVIVVATADGDDSLSLESLHSLS